jgi:hypothetical protein
MTTTPTVTPSPAEGPLPTILHGVLHGVWLGVSGSPVTLAATGFLVLVFVVKAVRAFALGPVRRDRVRSFSRADKAVLLSRAGGRREHHGWLTGRCPVKENLHADHIHPYSRGGQTQLANGAALCSRHNKAKGARVPWNWQLRQLEKRRRGYYPPGTTSSIVRRSEGPSSRRGRRTRRVADDG